MKFFFCILKVIEERSRIWSWIGSEFIIQRYWYRSADLNPQQNVTDPQHCNFEHYSLATVFVSDPQPYPDPVNFLKVRFLCRQQGVFQEQKH
jgi:hypothetical protein